MKLILIFWAACVIEILSSFIWDSQQFTIITLNFTWKQDWVCFFIPLVLENWIEGFIFKEISQIKYVGNPPKPLKMIYLKLVF